MGKTEVKGTRLMRKLIPGASWIVDGEGVFTNAAGTEGWNILITPGSNNEFAVWRGYFDIAGLSKQSLSELVGSPGWQESDDWSLEGPGTRPLIKTWDILSKASIPDSALEDRTWLNVSLPSGWNAPGMIRSNFNLEEIFAGRYRTFTQLQMQNSTGFLDSIAVGQSCLTEWGAGDATAGDKIHITRIVSLTDTMLYAVGILTTPPMAVLVPIALLEEPELVHLERMRRSYVEQDSRS